MKSIFNDIYARTMQRAAVGLCAAALLLFAGCVRDLESDTAGGPNLDGDIEFSLPFGVPSADARTRAQTTSETSIETLWIGMFATNRDGKLDGDALLVKTWDLYNLILPKDGTSYANLTFSINEIEKKVINTKLREGFGDETIDFTDADKNNIKFHFSAIANFKNVKARATMLVQSDNSETEAVDLEPEYASTEETELVYILRSMTRWREFCSIIIDAQSAFEQLYPLMSGSLSNVNSAPSQMLRPEDYSLHDDCQHVYTLDELCAIKYYDDKAPSGNETDQRVHRIRLRRVISNITVNLKADFGSGNKGYESVSIKNIRYAVMNYPKEFYLQERLLPDNPTGERKGADGGEFPSTRAILSNRELFEQYAPSVENFDNPADGYWMTAADARPVSVDGEYSWSGGTNTSTFTFSFIRYENKHLGIASTENPLATYTDREAVEEDGRFADGRFTALCPDGVLACNNFAPYFVIMADMEVVLKGQTEPLNIAARYVIHEGYSNDYEGSKFDDTTDAKLNGSDKEGYATRLRDFSCVRNTNYTYNVTITGVNSILVSVELVENGEQRNGVTGDVSSVIENVVFDGDGNLLDDNGNSRNTKELTFTLTNKDRKALQGKWLVVAPWRACYNGEWLYEHVSFGFSSIKVPQSSLVQSSGGDYVYANDAAVNRNTVNQFTDWVIFTDAKGNEKSIGEFASDFSDIENELDTQTHDYTVKVKEYEWKGTYYPFDADSDVLADTSGEKDSWSNPDEDARALWFCTDIVNSAHDSSTFQKIMTITQTVKDGRSSLPKPKIVNITSPMYIGKEANVEWTLDRDDPNYAEAADGVSHYSLRFNGTTRDIEYSSYLNAAYGFTVPATCEYGDILDFSIASYPQNPAMYKQSDAIGDDLMVFRESFQWSVGELKGFSTMLPALGADAQTYNDWVDIGNSLEVKGKITTREVGNDKDKAIQMAGAGMNNAVIKITIPASGLLTVIFSDTGNGTGRANRTLSVRVGEDGEEYVSTVSTANSTQVTEYFNLSFDDGPKDVYIYSTANNPGGLNIYTIKYEKGRMYVEPTVWDLGSSEWLKKIEKGNTRTINGLTVVADNEDVTVPSSNNCLQVAKGGPASNCLKFTALSSGTLTVKVTSNGGVSEGKQVTVQTGDGDSDIQQKYGGYAYTEPTDVKFDISVDTPTTIYIYCSSGGMRFYNLQYNGAVDK